jgi:antibiotic biosynthesis monooxygenase (ABM) superfamily enzyme
MPMEKANEPVTVIITRVVRQGSETAFENAVKAFIPKALAFSGHLGVHILRPSPGERDYGAVLKFRSHQEWADFRHSPDYQSFLLEIEPYLDGPPAFETLCGLESWFTPIGARVTRVPPRWKMALVTWIGVCLAVYVVNTVLPQLTPDWLWWARFLLGNAFVVAGLTWGLMPALNRLFRQWLVPSHQRFGPKESSTVR